MKYLLLMIILVSCGNPNFVKDEEYVLTELDLKLNSLIQKNGGFSKYIIPSSTDFNNIPHDKNNILNKSKVHLGKLLFHDNNIALSPRFESNIKSYSCSSCHHPEGGFSTATVQGFGEGGVGSNTSRLLSDTIELSDVDFQPVKTLTTLNVAYQKNTLWNGQFGSFHHNVNLEYLWSKNNIIETNFLGFHGVEIQAIAGLNAHRIINSTTNISEDFPNKKLYLELFKKSFKDEKYHKISQESIGLAIAAYERTILANKAPFQDYIKGNYNKLSKNEKKGAILFFGKANCIACHDGPSFSDGNFYAMGFKDANYNPNIALVNSEFNEKFGRGGFTNDTRDDFKFKTPQLYNLKDHASFGHGFSFDSIEGILNYKNKALSENPRVPNLYLSSLFKGINLSPEEISYLKLFLEKSLYDPDLKRYSP